MPVKAFLSYSLTKSHDVPATQGAFLRVRRMLVAEFGWEAVDAMDPDLISIATKVRAAILESDCVIADVSASTPNVMFEVGFAKALGYPVVVLLNFDAFESPHFREYFQVLGQSVQRPTPADLGDIEYLVYPGSDASEGEWLTFETTLRAKLARVAEHFTPEVRLLRRSVRRFQSNAFDFMEAHRPSNPIVGFLAGHVHAAADGLQAEGDRVFLTLGQFYADSMIAFADADGDTAARLGTVRAVADLAASPESIWDGAEDPLAIHIQERIFVLDTELLFDATRLERLSHIFREQGTRHPVFAVERSSVPHLHHPIGDAIGLDILLMEPDLVAAYVPRRLGTKDEAHLYVRRDPDDHLAGERYYAALRQRAFAVGDVTCGTDIVRGWLARSGVGAWNPEWPRAVESRPVDYFRDYDRHVRCWIPAYTHLVQQTGDIVSRLLLHRLLAGAGRLSVLEIGCGTGALTEVLARWLLHIDAPHREAAEAGVVDRLVALDPALPMLEAAEARMEAAFRRTPPFLAFTSGRLPDFVPASVERARFDVLCGSLVLHDLLEGADQGAMVDVLARLASRLRPGGSLVFADIFPDEDDEVRERQLEEWTSWMTDVAGIAPATVAVFLGANADMTRAPSWEAVRTAALTVAPNVMAHAEAARGAPGDCPFRVVTLTFPTIAD